MSPQELRSAWIAVSLAVENNCHDDRQSLLALALDYGKHISNLDHIEAVLAAIDQDKLFGLKEKK